MASTTCAFCNRYSHFTFVWGLLTNADATEVQFVGTCDNCQNVSIGKGQNTISNLGSNDRGYVEYALEESPDFQWWPKVGSAPAIADVPEHIARAARQAYSSASIGNHMAAILMARTVVEATAKEKDITTGSLASKIDAMRDADLIRPAIAEQAHEVRFAGNDMAHGDIDVEPTETDSEEILALMAEVLREVFQGPASLARIRAKRQAGAN